MPVQILGITIYEPVTVITNVMLALFCFLWFLKLQRQNRKYWPYFFLFIAIATASSAIGHGMYVERNNPVQMGSRILAMSGFMFADLDMSKRFSRRFTSIAIAACSIGLFVFSAVWILVHNEFTVVKFNGLLALLGLVGGTTAYGYFRNGNVKDAWVLAGVLVNGLAALVHTLEISISPWFNHNDIGHIIMIFGLYLIYRGIDEVRN